MLVGNCVLGRLSKFARANFASFFHHSHSISLLYYVYSICYASNVRLGNIQYAISGIDLNLLML